MGAEPLLHTVNDSEASPLILGLQPAALIDHVSRVDSSLLDRIPGDRGGSMPVGMEELENILREVKSYILSSPDDLTTPVKTIAGGSVANTIRGLSAGFGISCGIIGACGDDEQGKLFVSNMSSHGVNLSRLRMIKGPTAQMVRDFRLPLLQLLESGDIDLCFANEDEAKELIRGEKDADPEVALEFLAKHCQWAAVTLGANGCIAKHGKEIVRVPAIGESKATDATGAGDLFASGFLYGLVKGLSLEKCCQLGSCSGGSVIRALGGEVTPENWQWMHKHLQIKGLPLPEIRQ